jgi:hypothetical protein
VEELIGTLDVEERARTKDNGKCVETSTANVVQKRNFRKFNKKKNQNKQENTNKHVCWGLVLKYYELRTRQHKMLNVNTLRPSKHYFP